MCVEILEKKFQVRPALPLQSSRDRHSKSPSPSRASLSDSQDDLILGLGSLWAELNADAGATDRPADAGHDGSLTESLLDACSKILLFLDKEFLESELELPKLLVKEFLLAKHVNHLIPLMTDYSMEYVPVGDLEPHLRGPLAKYEANLDLFLHNLVTTGILLQFPSSSLPGNIFLKK